MVRGLGGNSEFFWSKTLLFMTAYIHSIWSARFFLLSLVKYDLNTRYRRSVLGIGWSLLQPIGMTIVLCTVFHRLFGLDITEFGPFLLAGLAFWGYFTNAVISGCQCYFQAEAYMRQYPAPPAIYPLRATLSSMFHLFMALGIVLMATWVLNHPDQFSLPYITGTAPKETPDVGKVAPPPA